MGSAFALGAGRMLHHGKDRLAGSAAQELLLPKARPTLLPQNQQEAAPGATIGADAASGQPDARLRPTEPEPVPDFDDFDQDTGA
jgi:hypothetical protein